ncbi:hypothetical protein [Curtobacterium aurantiacum]|uniref:hypothetical protein n=1 Tax=Curtobacterium aurantiacum TaxID=3236919 RepID=UPI001BE0CEF8|nr:hypothetical protein [Curtobacterium flaccumfaciens]MBT1676001.1 hypothetical protein [Curtobacterium flaccumfaciens pv. flaccumfaciens]
MAVGDAAGAAGLKVYDDSLLVTDLDTGLNQRGDELAAVMGRTSKVEKAILATPKFSVSRSSTGLTFNHDEARIVTGTAWAAPTKRVGGFTWSGGVLTVPRAGMYMVQATLKLNAEDYYAQYVMVTRNSEDAADAGAAVCRAVVYPGPRGFNDDPNVAPSITASRLCVSLNANDKLRVVGYQRNYGGQSTAIDAGSTSLTFEVLWVDEQ